MAEVTDYIITRSNRGFRVRGYGQRPDYAGQDQRFDRRMWSNACQGILDLLLGELKAARDLAAWAETLAARRPGTDVIAWMEMLYAKVSKYLQVSELFFAPILPTDTGGFARQVI